MSRLVLIIHNVRSCHNVGSLLRTAEGLGLSQIYITGYTPYPESSKDSRLPYVRARVAQRIHKTSLGAEDYVPWTHHGDIMRLLTQLRADGFQIVALEQTQRSVSLPKFQLFNDIALIVGNEVKGLDEKILKKTDLCIEIPMLGKKESFNVAVAAAMALYHLRFMT